MNSEPYIAYKKLCEARQKSQSFRKNFKKKTFKDRILKFQRSKPNPRTGGYFVSPNGVPENSGLRFDEPIDQATFEKLVLEDFEKVYFERGHVYAAITKQITTNNNTFGSYGTGVEPIWTGAEDLGTATSEAGGYYSFPLATAPLWVVNPAGEMARQGQSDWIPITSVGGGGFERTFSTAILNPFNTVESLINCKARFKEFNFRMSWEYTIGAYNTGTGVVGFSATVVGAAVGMPMKLYGQKQFATLEGDWWYDDPNNKLWIKTASNPTGLGWKVVTKNYGLDLQQADNFTVSGIEFAEYYRAAINTYRADATTVDAYIHDIRTNGLWLAGNSTGFNFTGEIRRCGLTGIFHGAISNATFHDFEIHNVGQQGNEPWPLDTYWRKHSGFGISASDDSAETNKLPSNITVQNFIINQVANIGVGPYGDNWLIENFDISEWASRFDDAGGIHPFYSNALGVGLSTKDGIIRDGFCHDGIGTHEGIAGYNQLSLISGVYFDSGTEDWEVDGLSSFDNPQCGLLVNFNGHGSNVHDSFFANNRGVLSQILYYEIPDVTNSPNFLRNQNNSFNNNVVISGNGQHAFLTASDGTGRDTSYNPFSGGTINNNTYYNLTRQATSASNPVAFSAMAKHASDAAAFGSVLPSSAHTIITFATWKTRTSGDAASTSAGFALDPMVPTQSIPQLNIYPNPTGSVAVESVTPSNTYNNLAGSTVNSYNVAAWDSEAAIIKSTYYLLMDHFFGTAGASISGRSPTIGNTPNILSGTHTLNTINKLVSSAAGLISWNLGRADFVFQVKMRPSIAGGALRFDLRYADATTSVTHRIIVDITTATGVRIRENNDSGSLVELGTAAAFTVVANNDYTVTMIANGTNLQIYVESVLYRNQAVNVVTGNYAAIFSDGSSNINATDYVLAYPIP